MDQQLKQKNLDNITKAQNILIAVSDQSGFDGLASGLALYLSLLKIGKNVSIVAKEASVDQARRLYAVDKIGKLKDRKTPVIVIDNAVESVDKVTYFLDQDKLKVVIHPLPGSKGVQKEDISFEFTNQAPNVIFSIGFDSKTSLQSKITHEQQISSDSWIINLGVSLPREKFAQVEYSVSNSNSVSEVTSKFIQEIALPLDEDIAFNLFKGISFATQNFSPALSSPLTFELAGWLMKFGAGKASLAFVESKQTGMSVQRNTQKGGLDLSMDEPQPKAPFFDRVSSLEELEGKQEVKDTQDWLKPPKIYKGSKSFGENKG